MAKSASRDVKMSDKRKGDRDDSLLLTSEDRANGFSIVAENRHNITLLKQGKQVAWFSAAVSRKVLKEFVQLVKYCERNAKGNNAYVRS